MTRPETKNEVVWENQATAAVDRWLSRPNFEPTVVSLVEQWNALELLGIDLADQLQDLTIEALSKCFKEVVAEALLSAVNWNQIAEVFAERYCGITERELTRRRAQALQGMLR